MIGFLAHLELSRYRKRILFVSALLLVVLMQWTCLRSKVQYVAPSLYASEATELQVTSKWRVGYVLAYHGARLIRTANDPLPVRQRDPESDEVWTAMREELRLVPLKTGLEFVLYLLLLIYGFFGAPWIVAGVLARTQTLIWRAGSVALVWAVGWTIIAAPLLILGYGQPIYSTWAGPGALSYSGPYFGQPSFGNGLTVSYRGVIEVVAPCISAMVVAATGLPRHLPNMTTATYLWLVGIVVYGIVGNLWQFSARTPSTSPEPQICPTCNTLVEDPSYHGDLGYISGRCDAGHRLLKARSFFGSLVLGVAGCIGWMLAVALSLDASGLHGRSRLAMAGVMLMPAATYAATKIRSGVKYRRAARPTSLLAKSHLGVGVGILGYLTIGVLAAVFR